MSDRLVNTKVLMFGAWSALFYPVLLIMGAVGMAALTFFPPMWWLIALYRLDRNPEMTHMLSDAGWLQWVGGLTIYYPTVVTLAIASFLDKSEPRIFPRWFGYVNI